MQQLINLLMAIFSSFTFGLLSFHSVAGKLQSYIFMFLPSFSSGFL